MAMKSDEDDEKLKQEELKRYNPTLPIYQITTDKILDLMLDYEDEIKNYNNEKNQEAIKNIKENLDQNLKYLIDKGSLKIDEIVSLLSMKKATTKNIKIYDKEKFTDEKLLNLFNVDKTDKKFQNALSSDKQDGAQWYYGGGTNLNLFVKIQVDEGERFDINRISNIEYLHDYEYKKGYGTVGEF